MSALNKTPGPKQSDQTEHLLMKKNQAVSIGEILKLINCSPESIKNNSGETVFRCIHCNRMLASRSKLTNKLITYDDFQHVLSHQKTKGLPIQETLVELGFVKEEDIVQELITWYGFPYLPLNNYEINKDAIEMVSYNLAIRHCSVPIEKMGSSLTIAMANPLDASAIIEIEVASKCIILPFVSTISDIKKAIDRCYKN